jgi:hypothetical protein
MLHNIFPQTFPFQTTRHRHLITLVAVTTKGGANSSSVTQEQKHVEIGGMFLAIYTSNIGADADTLEHSPSFQRTVWKNSNKDATVVTMDKGP